MYRFIRIGQDRAQEAVDVFRDGIQKSVYAPPHTTAEYSLGLEQRFVASIFEPSYVTHGIIDAFKDRLICIASVMQLPDATLGGQPAVIEFFVVSQQKQGLGIGGVLLSVLKRQYSELAVVERADNSRSLSFFSKNGFKVKQLPGSSKSLLMWSATPAHKQPACVPR